MSVSVTLENGRAYTREAMLLIGGGAAAGILTQVLELVAATTVAPLAALTFGSVLGLGANLTDAKEGTPMLRLILAILGGILWAGLMMTVHPLVGAGVGGFLIGAGYSLEEGDTRLERAWNWTMYAIALALGAFTASALIPSGTGFLGLVGSGLIWGVFLAFAGGLKRLNFSRDEISSEFKEAEAELDGQEKDNVRNGRALYEQIVRELERARERRTRDRATEIARETSRALIALARRSAELSVAAQVTSQRHLQMRVIELDERIKVARDQEVKVQLEATLDELLEQLRVRERLNVARARLEARGERCFTALERLHVTLLQGASGALGEGALDESIENLERLSEEIHWRNLSVEELVGDDVRASLTPEDDLLQRIREEHDAAESDQEVELELDAERTVLDSQTRLEEPESAEDEVSFSDDPPGTDGSVSAVEEASHVQSKTTG